MKPQQEYLLKLLAEIDELCRKHDIQYFLAYGSLLGACRNGGFLPWDDDADILMTKPNLERFKEVCKAELPDNRILGGCEIQESYPYLITRYIALDTTAIHNSQSLHSDIAGELIDIIALDPVSDSEQDYQDYVKYLSILHDIVKYSSVASSRFGAELREFDEYQQMKEEHGKLYAVEQLRKRMEETFDADGSTYVMRWQGCPIRLKREWFEESTDIQFEGMTLQAPKAINEFLTGFYGEEWAEMPPKIIPAKHNTASSLNFSYTEALEYFEPLADSEELQQRLLERKRNVIAEGADTGLARQLGAQALANKAQVELERKLANRQDELNRAIANEDVPALISLLGDYVSAQIDRRIIGRHAYNDIQAYRDPILIQVSDDVFAAGLLVLMCTSRIAHAVRLLEIRESKGLPLSPAMEEIKSNLELFHTSTNNYQYGNLDKSLEEARLLQSRYPNSTVFNKLLVTVLDAKRQTSGNAADLEELRAANDFALNLFPEDGYFLKVRVDCLVAAGAISEQEAEDGYLYAAERTRNGFAVSDIQRKTGYAPTWMRNTAWGELYGIPQWEKPLPDNCVPQVTEDGKKAIVGDKNQTFLINLLDELCAYCTNNGIDYVLSAPATSALVEHKMLPDKIGDFGILCTASNLKKLHARLQKNPLPNRMLSGADFGPAEKPKTIRLFATDTTFIKMGKTNFEANPFFSVAINLLPAGWEKKPTAARRPVIAGCTLRSRTPKNRLMRALASRLMGRGGAPWNGFIISKEWKQLDGAASLPRPVGALQTGKYDLLSPELPASYYKERDVVPQEYFPLKQQIAQRKVPGINACKTEFATNYNALKQAVRLKEVAFNLLPQKEAILDLEKSGDEQALRDVLKPYLPFVAKTPKGVKPVIDEDLYRIAKTLV